MPNVIPKDTRYVPLTQQKSCCVPTSISIVMYKRGIPLVPIELLGYHLGLIVAPENKKLFYHPRVGKRPPAGYGTRVSLKKYSPNAAFKKLKIPLKLVVYPISSFKTKQEFVNFAAGCVKKDRDVLVCFNHGLVGGSKENNGHVCVLDTIYPKRGVVRLIDPSSSQPKWREIKVTQLKKAMEGHPTKTGGFWELVKTK